MGWENVASSMARRLAKRQSNSLARWEGTQERIEKIIYLGLEGRIWLRLNDPQLPPWTRLWVRSRM